MQQLYLIGIQAGIQPFEFVRGIYLEHEQFTIENGLLTGEYLHFTKIPYLMNPWLGPHKLKRQALSEHYGKTLEKLYDHLDDPENMQKALLEMIGNCEI